MGLVICGFCLAGRRWIVWTSKGPVYCRVYWGGGHFWQGDDGQGKGVVVLVEIVGMLGSFVLGSGEFVGLTTSHLFLNLFYRDVCFWGNMGFTYL